MKAKKRGFRGPGCGLLSSGMQEAKVSVSQLVRWCVMSTRGSDGGLG